MKQGDQLPATIPFRIQRLDLARDLSLIALEGEVCIEYVFKMEKALTRRRTIIPVGYANGVAAYIPSAELIPEGGYEVDGSYWYFGRPAPFFTKIGEVIMDGTLSLFRGW